MLELQFEFGAEQAGQKSQDDENVSNDSQGLDQFAYFHDHRLAQLPKIFKKIDLIIVTLCNSSNEQARIR